MDAQQPASISPRDLYGAIGTSAAPLVFDVRRSAGFEADDRKLALSLGLAANFADDREMLEQGMVMYDAFYTWCRSLQGGTHNGHPAPLA